MNPRPRITVRRLLQSVAILAVVLALVRHPYRVIREQQRFLARQREGEALLDAYRPHCPPLVSPAAWSQAVDVVHNAWGNVVFAPGSINDEDLDAILAELRRQAPLATPAEAEGELYHILDLLDHARTRAGVRYLANMRIMLKSALPRQGRPGTGLVAYALSRLGPTNGDPPLNALLDGMRSDDWATRVACCRALGPYAMGLETPSESQAALVGLLGAFEDDDWVVREIAVECVRDLGPWAARARMALLDRRARDLDVRVRWQALRALLAIERNPAALVPALVAALEDGEEAVRRDALDALAELGPNARDALPAIRKALADRDESTRGAAASAIARVAPPAEVAVPALIGILGTDPSWQVRAKAIEALGRLGARATAALPAIVERLANDDAPATRMAAAQAIPQIAPDDPRTVAALARALASDASTNVRWDAAVALGQIGPPAASAIPKLTDTLRDPDFSVRKEAETALEKIRARP